MSVVLVLTLLVSPGTVLTWGEFATGNLPQTEQKASVGKCSGLPLEVDK